MISDTTVASDEVLINAPIARVWEILVDFAQYEAWNGFCPSAEAELKVGSPIRMMVDLGEGPHEQVEYITRIEPEHLIAWGMENKPGDPIHAERTQILRKVDDNSCTYISIDEFSGPAAAQMLAVMGKPVEDGFNRCAQDLKRYAQRGL